MSDFLERIDKLSPKRLALLALELHEQVEAAAERAHEPIAIIGMGCRFPGGADDPRRFWDLLRTGRDAIREVPADRWDIDALFDPDPDTPARMSVRSGGFLDQVDGFDAAFFGISPREALTMDPQQRLLLEVAWEALEHAGLAPERLAGTATGVFLGVCNSDHFQRVLQRGNESIDAYLASGSAHSVAAGRIAYFLGLQGPALAIDTACSSSLVALHVACHSLRRGESRIALAAGVNLMCAPETTIALSRAHMLAPDGRCKTFDAGADGFSRGEGCGVLVLKRLSDAQADGDRVLALVRGSASNQDGRSGGLTVPNGPAQEAVIRAALADARVDPADIAYVEAHGTGTSLGDPIEVRALAGALGLGRDRTDPLLIGSVKTNIGHLESAAGIAGVVKVVLALQHECIPAHLHFKQPSPHIAWSEYPVAVTSEARPWPRGERRRLAGVSSFGFSGTNAHVILEEAPLLPALVAAPARLRCLPLSARSEPALLRLAKDHAAALANEPGIALAEAAHTAGVGRSHFGERLAVVAASVDEARAALTDFADGRMPGNVHRGRAVPGQAPEVVFLFTGQGSQYPGMSEALYRGSPMFSDIIDRCDTLLGADTAGRTLKTVLFGAPTDAAPIHETAWTQPALFAVEYALAQLWRSWGIEPAAVIGHSVGEYVAACVAGVFTLEQGLKLIAERGRLMQSLAPGGAMAAVFASADEVAAAATGLPGRLAIAAINAPDSVVVSGDDAAVEALLADLAQRDVQGQRLFISLAAHSPLVEPALDAMQALAADVPMQPPRIPVAWNLTGGALPAGTMPDAHYWRRHMREPVRFADGIAWLHDQGFRSFLEVGPHPTLIALAQRSLPQDGVQCLTSLRRGKDDWHELMTSLASLYVQGASVDWAGIGGMHGADAPRRVSLPTYPFERRSFWIAAVAPGTHRPSPRAGDAHPLLGERLPTATPVFEILLTPDAPAYLAEHRVHGAVLAAGPVFLEMAQACVRHTWGAGQWAVEDFAILEPLVLPDAGRAVQVHLGGDPDDVLSASFHSRPDDGRGEWRLHATARLRRAAADSAIDIPAIDVPATATAAELEASLAPATPCDAHYQRLADLGIQLGPMFRSMQTAQRCDAAALTELALPPGCTDDAVVWAHPALLDGALQTVGLALPASTDTHDVHLLTGIERIELTGPLPPRLMCHARLRAAATARPGEWRADVTLCAMDGTALGSIRGVTLRRAARETLQRAVGAAAASDDKLFYQVAWEPAPTFPTAARHLAAPQGFTPEVRRRFAALADRHGLSVYEQLLPELDRLSADHIAAALRQLGFEARPGRMFTAVSEAAHLGVDKRHARLFARLLDMLAEDGVLRRQAAGFEVVAPLPSTDPATRYDALLNRFGAVNGELSTLRRCGSELSRVLKGELDPLQLLFPGGSFAEARALYVDSPYARTYNAALGEALRAAIAPLPADSRLRVLEIGAGTGGTTGYVLPLLPPDRTEYTFTDLSPLFLERAAEQFADCAFMRRALLDIERDPLEQGFEPGRYDIVIAANVLHATADLRQALQHASRVLAPGGLLLLLEGVAPERWVDLTFGLTDGWWRFTDSALRPAYPLIDREGWIALLGELGYSDVAAVPDSSWRTRGAAQQALIVARAPAPRRRWALLGDRGGVGAALARRLEARGDEVTLLATDAADARLDLADEVVYLGARELADRRADDPRGAAGSAALAYEVPLGWLSRMSAAATDAAPRRIWFVTQGAVPAQGELADGARWQAPLWGLGRVFALEQPGRWGGLVDLPPHAPMDAQADTLLAAIDANDGEDQTAWRSGRRLAARLQPAVAPAAVPVRFRADATYLVTGGFGGLGLIVARWLAAHGARSIALLGRHPDLGLQGVRDIETLGAKVFALTADVADEAAMATQLQLLAIQAPPLRGVMHAAADLSAAPIAQITSDQASRMWRPKVDGTLVLERLTRHLAIDFTVLFSSSTALLGASGLAHYAAANHFLDAVAHDSNRVGRRVLSVNWGTWEAMRLASADDQRSYRESGLEAMPAARALDALGRLLAGAQAQAMVAQIDWSVLKPLHEARRARPFLAQLAAAAAPRRVAAAAVSGPSLAERFAAAPAGLRHDLLIDFVQQAVAAVLGLQGNGSIPLATGLFDLGMDSLMAVELKRSLERGSGRGLPSTLTFNYPNVGALARFFEVELKASAPAAPTVPASATAAHGVALNDAELDALTDDELEARLLARLEQIE